jgi:hypothetical protein
MSRSIVPVTSAQVTQGWVFSRSPFVPALAVAFWFVFVWDLPFVCIICIIANLLWIAAFMGSRDSQSMIRSDQPLATIPEISHGLASMVFVFEA